MAFYQDRKDAKDHDIVSVTSKNLEDVKIIRCLPDKYSEKFGEKLKKCYSEGKVPVLFHVEPEAVFVMIVNKVWKASIRTERLLRMSDILDFVTVHEEIPLSTTLDMLMAAATGNDGLAHLQYCASKREKKESQK